MMADLAGALSQTDDQVRPEEWVPIGDVLPLRTHAADLRVTSTPDGGFVFELRARDGYVLEEPTSVIGDGGLAIRVAVR